MFIYGQRSGNFWLRSQSDENLLGQGYSGKKGASRNNPQHEEKAGEGPIPKGVYACAPAIHHRRLGRLSIRLIPIGHDARGRTGFYIHGDNAEKDASTGCIVLGPKIRQKVANAIDLDPDDVTVEVV